MPEFDFGTVFSTWHLTRAAGLTAYFLLFIIVACGLITSLQLAPAKYRPTLFNAHKSATIALMFFVSLHVMILLADKHLSFSLADILIPFWSNYDTWLLTSGILSLYALIILIVASFPAIIKIVGKNIWRNMHYLAFPAFWLGLYHALFLGTDSGNLAVSVFYASTAAIIISLTLLRVFKTLAKRGNIYAHSARGR